jgi:two-component system, OmpR family, sensor histidine kinase VicK
MAKIDSGRIVLARQDTNMNELLHDIAGEQKPDIENAKHTIALKLPKKPILLHVDTHMLRMAIENLLSNAIKYTPQGGNIVVKMHKDADNLHIVISDNGVGIDEADFSKLFKQFTRLPNEMSQRVSGTGVGLYLAKHLVALHHGSISVRSKLAEGATFTITLPIEPNNAKKDI